MKPENEIIKSFKCHASEDALCRLCSYNDLDKCEAQLTQDVIELIAKEDIKYIGDDKNLRRFEAE